MLNLLNPYFYLITLRNWLYDHGFLKIFKVEAPVVSVGNLSVGGSGKTSLVRYLAEELSSLRKVAIVSRGYKRRSKGFQLVYHQKKVVQNIENAGDEPYLLAKVFEKKGVDLVIIVDEDRVRGAKKAIKDFGANLILLDDGFQHRRLFRDIDFVLLKKKDLSQRVLPFGKLREPFSALKRATAFILTYQELSPFDFSFNQKPVFKLYRENWQILNHRLEVVNPKEMEFIAFCGLGDNQQFLHILNHLGLKIKRFIPLPDHYNYRGFNLFPYETYLTTLKDGVKLPWSENLFFLDFSIRVEGLLAFIKERLNL
ncbi:tetraacyldisaccharide 4'-kinase [Thermodesulfobacterium sp. TA1]|uniref:tetraacyldisaccharide 4'-kinase n=1 Tax=Thermodesulfobacterium sp. TA1 TaxID=2234087 RepID=UPI00123215CF|nr:tetraacyldisaccharide 4'-kinase [Thermodesulfobacterium sp. TA1]QER41745.1 tetraacyldisaccharide 4'-kinase [Thermodesulfobacterium sp. TA1]